MRKRAASLGVRSFEPPGDETLATSAQRRLARWMLAQESHGQSSPLSAAHATGQVWERLSTRLAALFAASGSQALGKRAVYLAQEDFSFLRLSGGNLGMDELGPFLEGRDREQAAAAAETVYANLVGLLVTFIGEDLTLRAIRDVWPDATLDEPGTNAQEAQP